jgi:hypothetical protein
VGEYNSNMDLLPVPTNPQIIVHRGGRTNQEGGRAKELVSAANRPFELHINK